ncbi:MAG: wax ester/triacylglycerol synthase family O-acyltransferase, partial [Acidimicrobiia bacterium]|nr:wax ester/triacylglycerol synthase family O-acyltransferase [Acidimicrobiia bacterium]
MAYDRLTGLDASFLHLESEAQPMHVGSLAVFEGPPFFDDAGRFRLEEAREVISSRLHLVPRFRKKIMTVPFGQGRPVWVDDHDFDLNYHVRLTALPKPGSEEQLKTLMGRLQSTVLDRRRPLWELWFVEGLEGDRVAIIQKTHHALVDGISGVDVATVLLDFEPHPEPVTAPNWTPATAPQPMELLRDSVVERVTVPAEMVRSARAAVRGPRRVLDRVGKAAQTLAAMGSLAPRTPLNVAVGPHRRVEFVRADLAPVKEAKQTLGATVNDVVLAAVAGGLRHFLEARGEAVDGLTLKAFVPVSVRDDSQRMALGNKVAGIVVDLPVGVVDPAERVQLVGAQTRLLKESRQAVGAEVLTGLADYAPATLFSLAARLMPFQRAV